jgi:hypothetical protein
MQFTFNQKYKHQAISIHGIPVQLSCSTHGRSKFHISSLQSMEIGASGILFVGKSDEPFFSVIGKSFPEC